MNVTAAPDNLSTLKQFKVATTDLNIPLLPQEGKNADALRKNLETINLPPGFKIDLFAIVLMSRHMALPRRQICFSLVREKLPFGRLLIGMVTTQQMK